MNELLESLSSVDLDPVASPLGIAVIAIGGLVLIKAVKTVVKVAMVAILLIGAYLFLYGGNL